MIRHARAAALLLCLAACKVAPGGEDPPAQARRDTVPAAPGDTARTAAALRDTSGAARRQLVYVPVYSHIFFRTQRNRINLAVTLSVRNTDPEHPVTVSFVRYYDTAGRLLHAYLDAPVHLGPLASAEYVVEEADERGGVGANFLVEWTAARPVTEPVIEAVMISTAANLGISFTSVGRPLVRR